MLMLIGQSSLKFLDSLEKPSNIKNSIEYRNRDETIIQIVKLSFSQKSLNTSTVSYINIKNAVYARNPLPRMMFKK